MVKTGERRIENNQTGFKLATSVGGVSTGERGARPIEPTAGAGGQPSVQITSCK
jgi:hypothetical protein